MTIELKKYAAKTIHADPTHVRVVLHPVKSEDLPALYDLEGERADACAELLLDDSAALALGDAAAPFRCELPNGHALNVREGCTLAMYSTSEGLTLKLARDDYSGIETPVSVGKEFDADNVPDGTPGHDVVADEVAMRAVASSNSPLTPEREAIEELRTVVAKLERGNSTLLKVFSIDPERIVQAFEVVDGIIDRLERIERDVISIRTAHSNTVDFVEGVKEELNALHGKFSQSTPKTKSTKAPAKTAKKPRAKK